MKEVVCLSVSYYLYFYNAKVLNNFDIGELFTTFNAHFNIIFLYLFDSQ